MAKAQAMMRHSGMGPVFDDEDEREPADMAGLVGELNTPSVPMVVEGTGMRRCRQEECGQSGSSKEWASQDEGQLESRICWSVSFCRRS